MKFGSALTGVFKSVFSTKRFTSDGKTGVARLERSQFTGTEAVLTPI